MKFECEKTLLANAIDGVSRAITNRAAIPVLEGIYLKAEGFAKKCRFRKAETAPVEVLPGTTLDITTWEKLWR